jgi:hypothetical protein
LDDVQRTWRQTANCEAKTKQNKTNLTCAKPRNLSTSKYTVNRKIWDQSPVLVTIVKI